MAKSPEEKDEIELRPNGWERFEKAVDAAIKGGPKHATKKVSPKKGDQGDHPGRPKNLKKG
jgi:hypothetical protein